MVLSEKNKYYLFCTLTSLAPYFKSDIATTEGRLVVVGSLPPTRGEWREEGGETKVLVKILGEERKLGSEAGICPSIKEKKEKGRENFIYYYYFNCLKDRV